MTTCTHDPAFTTDGICYICHHAAAARIAAVLEQHGATPVLTLDELADSIIADMEARTAETTTEAPQHEGMWK